jgi:NAD(P)-dependent dehydrogenase (short-subunit alcohol dehydrogenase family)
VKRVLVLGGYGTFGGRIAARAAAAGFEVLVAGRSRARAEAFCAGSPALKPLVLDRDDGLAAALAEHRPFALVDAAGPFQGQDHRVARAALTAGCHYLDIADGRDFVAGIAALDAEARAAGVACISGASSLPALSGAAVRRLAAGIDRVAAVEIALSASSRGTAGRSVVDAILSYLGRPVRLRRGGRWTEAIGWQELRAHAFHVRSVPPLRRRLVALAEVPDLDLLPRRLPGDPAVAFRAGTDSALHMLGLWLLSWPVRWGWMRDAPRLAGLLSRLQHWTRAGGSRRSAFEVRLFGVAGRRRLERRWTLIAERGDGPEIPSLAVPILLARLAAGAVPPGATDAGTLLALEDFEPALAALAVSHAVVEDECPPPLYARVMGEDFGRLPRAVRAMHEVLRDGGAGGRAVVGRGRNPLARLVAALLRFPPEGEHRLHVTFAERQGVERWTRDFSGRRFSSRLSARGGGLEERFGPFSFAFRLPVEEAGLAMEMTGWRLGPLPLPLALAPRTPAREWEEDGRFHFDVAIALPLVGPVVRYRGWLEPPVAAPSPLPGGSAAG